MPAFTQLTLNKHRNIGQLSFEQVDTNWDNIESTVNAVSGSLAGQFPNDNLTATTDPTANDDSTKDYSNFSRWYNSTNQTLWVLTDPTPGDAVWIDTGFEYLWLGSASVANIGTGPTEVPTNNMFGGVVTKNTLSGSGDIPLVDSDVNWTGLHTFVVNDSSSIATQVATGFPLITQSGAGTGVGIAFEIDTVSANFGINDSGELVFGGGSVSGVEYAVFHSGNAATASELVGGSASKAVTSDTIYEANAPATSSGSGAFAPDFSAARVFHRTITGNSTLENPTNIEPGMSGLIVLEIDGTGGYTLTAPGTYYKFVGGTPTFSTTASNKNVISYYVLTATFIIATYLGTV